MDRPASERDDGEEGLCVTCSKRRNCERRFVEGGVWHCSAYSEDERSDDEVPGGPSRRSGN